MDITGSADDASRWPPPHRVTRLPLRSRIREGQLRALALGLPVLSALPAYAHANLPSLHTKLMVPFESIGGVRSAKRTPPRTRPGARPEALKANAYATASAPITPRPRHAPTKASHDSGRSVMADSLVFGWSSRAPSHRRRGHHPYRRRRTMAPPPKRQRGPDSCNDHNAAVSTKVPLLSRSSTLPMRRLRCSSGLDPTASGDSVVGRPTTREHGSYGSNYGPRWPCLWSDAARWL